MSLNFKGNRRLSQRKSQRPFGRIWKRWVPWLIFVGILALGLSAGLAKHLTAVHQGRCLLGPGLDQRLDALNRLQRLDYLARAARGPLVRVLVDERKPPAALAAKRYLARLRPPVIRVPVPDVAEFSVSSRAGQILALIVPFDYPWFRRTVLSSGVLIRFRAAQILTSIAVQKPVHCIPAVRLLDTLLGDPAPIVRRTAFTGLTLTRLRADGRGVIRIKDLCSQIIARAAITLDPDVGYRAALFIYKHGLPDNFVIEAFARAWVRLPRPRASQS